MQPVRISDVFHGAPVLSFRDCVLPLTGTEGETLALTFDLYPGELFMVHIEDQHHEDTLARATSGLLLPLSGSVKFLGQDWRALPADRANAMRGRIGVAFRADSWIPYQTVMESIILPELHHTHRPVDEICNEASVWALRFGLPGLPNDIPAAVNMQDRQCASLIRAFVGKPSLVVVEHQSASFPSKRLQILINALREVRERGAAVLWFTQDLSLGLDKTIPATRRLRLDGPTLCPLEPAI